MKKVMILSLAALVMAFMCTACGGGKQIKEDTGPAIFFPGEYIESVDATTDMVKCTGKGLNMEAASLNLRQACMEWMVKEKLAQDPSERRAYMANQKAFLKKVDRYVGAVKAGSAAGPGEGTKDRKRLSDDSIQLVAIVKVFKKDLMADLVDMNIIQSKNEMLDKIGRPTLATIPFKATKGSKLRGMMEGVLNSYLTTNKWEVASAAGVADLDKLVDAIGEVAEAEEDEAAKIAMAVGADIYVLFESKKHKKGDTLAFGVRLEVRETTTQKMLASEEKIGPARVDWVAGQEQKAMGEPMRDAMAKILPQITGYWKEDAPFGRRYYLVFKNTPKKTNIRMAGVLKKACSRVKQIRKTSSEVVFQVQCKKDEIEMETILDDGITAKLDGAENEIFVTRSSLIVVFN